MNNPLFTLQINLAAPKQFLRDRSETLTDHQINKVLDQFSKSNQDHWATAKTQKKVSVRGNTPINNIAMRNVTEELKKLLRESRAAINEAASYLISKGEVVDWTNWVTVKEYCRRFDIKNTETVSNWIRRGVIPVEDTMIVEEFNNIRMVRAKPYPIKAETLVW